MISFILMKKNPCLIVREIPWHDCGLFLSCCTFFFLIVDIVQYQAFQPEYSNSKVLGNMEEHLLRTR